MKKIMITAGLILAGLGINAKPVKYIGGTLAADLYLYKDTCYILSASMVVPNTYKLEIEEGTEVRCDAGTSVIIERGAQILAMGTVSEPIIFTSAQAVNNRTAGDWGGLLLLGYASNNVVDNGGGIYNIYRAGANRAGGGTPIDDAYNAGTIQYTRIEYAGGGLSGETEVHALALNGTGSATVIDHVQISDCLGSGLWMGGGTTDVHTVYVLNAYQKGVKLTLGNRSQLQTILVQSKDPAAHDAAGTDGLFIENNPSNTGYQPYTKPIMSNVTLLGINACDDTPQHADFRDGIYLTNNARADIYNSVVTGFGNGLFIQDALTAQNTMSTPNNELNVSYCSFTDNILSDYDHGSFTWSGNGCSASMGDWIEFVTTGCSDADNHFGAFNTNYNSSLCGNFCEDEFEPNFVIETPVPFELQFPDYDGLPPFFNTPSYRGALQTAAVFDVDWIAVCPQNEAYCMAEQPKSVEKAMLHLYPNPSQQYTEVGFESAVTGKAVVSIVDRVSGRVLQTATVNMTDSGKQRIKLHLQNLPDNIYLVRVAMPDQILHAQLVVKQ